MSNASDSDSLNCGSGPFKKVAPRPYPKPTPSDLQKISDELEQIANHLESGGLRSPGAKKRIMALVGGAGPLTKAFNGYSIGSDQRLIIKDAITSIMDCCDSISQKAPAQSKQDGVAAIRASVRLLAPLVLPKGEVSPKKKQVDGKRTRRKKGSQELGSIHEAYVSAIVLWHGFEVGKSESDGASVSVANWNPISHRKLCEMAKVGSPGKSTKQFFDEHFGGQEGYERLCTRGGSSLAFAIAKLRREGLNAMVELAGEMLRDERSNKERDDD